MLGKILRLDVDGDAAAARQPAPAPIPTSGTSACAIPGASASTALTGDLYIGDVGQDAFEEIDVEPRGQGGRNYGWNVTEGFALLPAARPAATRPASRCPPSRTPTRAATAR